MPNPAFCYLYNLKHLVSKLISQTKFYFIQHKVNILSLINVNLLELHYQQQNYEQRNS